MSKRREIVVLFKGKRAGERVDRKKDEYRRYETGHGTDLRTGTEDYSFSGPCTAMQKLARELKRIKGTRVQLYEGDTQVEKLTCKRKRR